MASELVVHCKRAPYDVYIGRPGPWGNPIHLTKEEYRPLVLERYRQWLESDVPNAQWVRDHIEELRGKTLGCWCAPKLCHGDVLAELANAR